ncbi:MAG: SpoIIE family protein phosphatase [Acidobacteriota bacterium]
MDFLTVIPPHGGRSRTDLDAKGVTIGRSSTNDVVLEDPSVSRLHARILRRSEGYYVVDASSKHGTYVNGHRRTEPRLLHPGDRIVIGRTTLIFNGVSTGSVQFSDRPLAGGPGTTIISGEARRSSSAHAAPRIEGPATDEFSTPVALDILTKANEELVFHRPLPQILERIMDLAHRAVPYERGLLMLLENGQLVQQVVRMPEDEADSTISISRTIADRVTKAQDSVLTSDAQIDDRFREGVSVAAQNLRSVMCVPLWNNRDVIGLLYVDNRQRAGLFTESDLRLLTHLANVAAVKIENARLFEQTLAFETMKQELDKAAEIQNTLLPQGTPSIQGYQIYGQSDPCAAVGGDYFDYAPLPEGRHAIAIGDVAGKGLPAALLMCVTQASFRALLELDLPPGETLARLNRLLNANIPDNRFVTFFYGVLDPARRLLSYANAGHNPPMVLRRDDDLERLPVHGPPLGLGSERAVRPDALLLDPADLLVCFSDGVTEARGPADRMFGEERLIGAVRRGRSGSATDIVHRIAESLREHHAGAHPADDITLVVLKRTA